MSIENYKKEIEQNDFVLIPLEQTYPQGVFRVTSKNHFVKTVNKIVKNNNSDFHSPITVTVKDKIERAGYLEVNYSIEITSPKFEENGNPISEDVRDENTIEEILFLDITCRYFLEEDIGWETNDFPKVFFLGEEPTVKIGNLPYLTPVSLLVLSNSLSQIYKDIDSVVGMFSYNSDKKFETAIVTAPKTKRRNIIL